MTTVSKPQVPLVAWILLLPIGGLFFMLAMAMKMQFAHGVATAFAWPVWLLPVLIANTGLLVTSCVMLHVNQSRWASRFTLVFIVCQALIWLLLHVSQINLLTSQQTSYFYLISGLHALHLAGGMLVVKPLGAKAINGTRIYWDFLLLAWLVMLWMLFA